MERSDLACAATLNQLGGPIVATVRASESSVRQDPSGSRGRSSTCQCLLARPNERRNREGQLRDKVAAAKPSSPNGVDQTKCGLSLVVTSPADDAPLGARNTPSSSMRVFRREDHEKATCNVGS